MNAPAPVDAVHAFSSDASGRTHYRRAGPVDGPVVVFVSGATLPMAVWEPLAAKLVDAGFHVLRYDLPGRGHTRPLSHRADFQAHLDQLEALLNDLDIRQPVRLVGLASGALVVAAYASANPARVSHAALIAPDGAATHFTPTERLLGTPVIGDLLFRLSARRTLLARIPRYSSRPQTRAFVEELLMYSLGTPGFHQAVLATVRTFPLHDGEAQYRKLRDAGIPTCVVWGAEDLITPAAAAGVFTTLFGRDAVHVLQGAGHLPFVEAPASVGLMLERHFAGSRPGF